MKVAPGRTAIRCTPDDASLSDVLKLIHKSFAYMEARIDPPSSVHALDIAVLRSACTEGEVWRIGTSPDACVVLSHKPKKLYLGKLAVRESCRGRGLARALVETAVSRAQHHGYAVLELEVRIELVENQQAFSRLGFEQVGTSSHAGYNRPTSVTMQRAVVT